MDADAQRLKAVLAAEIIKALDRERLTLRAAHSRTGIAAAGLLPHPARGARAVHLPTGLWEF